MNYINNNAAGLCCGLNSSDKIEVSETTVMIDCETGELIETFGFVIGRTYRCEKRWTIRQSYNMLKTFETEEEAREAYRNIIAQLEASTDNTVIEI